jgi:hypothetical protein
MEEDMAFHKKQKRERISMITATRRKMIIKIPHLTSISLNYVKTSPEEKGLFEEDEKDVEGREGEADIIKLAT